MKSHNDLIILDMVTGLRNLGKQIMEDQSYGDEINISLKKSLNNIILFVDDNGPGIPNNEKENVLKPFYKIDKSRNESKSGVGLGLSIASDIIKSHGGDLSLSESPKKGLRVKISLPL